MDDQVEKLKQLLLPVYRPTRQLADGISFLAEGTLKEMRRVPAVIAPASLARYALRGALMGARRTVEGADDVGKAVSRNTISHNLKGLQLTALRAFSGERPHILLRVVSFVETVNPDVDRILFIGPRAESELLLARSYGFKHDNIRGLDLISYSDRVDLGDMHAMPYQDNAWDQIILGWVLAYSDRPEVACQEVIRVAKPGALVAIGVQHTFRSKDQANDLMGYQLGGKDRLETTDQILEMFKPHVDRVYFRHDIVPERKHLTGQIMLVFSIKK